MSSRYLSSNGSILAAILFLATLPGRSDAQTIRVSDAAQLQSAVAAANGAGGNRTILLADGTYTLTDTLYVNAPGIKLTGESGDQSRVIVQGDAMSSTASVGTLIRVAASGFQLSFVTLQKSRYHLIQIVGESNADSPRITNCVLRDAYEQMVKVTKSATNVSDDGLIENCLFEYSAGIGPQYYIGGIDAHGAKNWLVRQNTFRAIASPSGTISEFAVHFWDGSDGNIVERNLIVDSDRGIGFGIQSQGNSGGIIRNNMIYHSANNHAFADTGIDLLESPGTQVYNNTVFFENGYPNAIEYRFASTQNVLIANNLTNRAIASRDSATGTLSNNVTNATSAWFVSPQAGNLHLKSALSQVVDSGRTITGLTDDFDGQPRPAASGIDIGADEFSAASVPRAPTSLQAN